tara:strand:+ start:387 stop:875 length:489 start_codon:yes stop_codon:yes gene_type:complete
MLGNEIVLRPRFKIELEQSSNQLVAKFSAVKKAQDRFIVSCVDDHIFIKFSGNKQHFWSPQLHLEVFESTETKSSLHGFFGPNPTVWTMFIFLHVAVGILFLVNATWMYSNYNLENPIGLQIIIAVVLSLLWVVLYVAGSMGKRKGKPGMREMYDFMTETIS